MNAKERREEEHLKYMACETRSAIWRGLFCSCDGVEMAGTLICGVSYLNFTTI